MRLTLGTAQFGMNYGISNLSGKIPDDELTRLIELARASGVTTLDTAAVYGDSEKRIGNAATSGFRIITKVPKIPKTPLSPDQWLRYRVNQSLRNLQRDCIDVLLLHCPSDLESENGGALIRELQALKRNSVIRRFGYSVYSPSELARLTAILTPDCVQVPVNIFDRRFIDSGALNSLFRQGIEVFARSIFLQGLLLMPPEKRPIYFKRWRALLASYDAWLCERGLSAVEANVQFIRGQEQLSSAVIGVASSQELEEVLSVFNAPKIPVDNDFTIQDELLLNPSMWRTT